MRGKKSDLGRNDIENCELRSIWGRFSLNCGIYQINRNNNKGTNIKEKNLNRKKDNGKTL